MYEVVAEKKVGGVSNPRYRIQLSQSDLPAWITSLPPTRQTTGRMGVAAKRTRTKTRRKTRYVYLATKRNTLHLPNVSWLTQSPLFLPEIWIRRRQISSLRDILSCTRSRRRPKTSPGRGYGTASSAPGGLTRTAPCRRINEASPTSEGLWTFHKLGFVE